VKNKNSKKSTRMSEGAEMRGHVLLTRDEIDTEKCALRALLGSFHLEQECLLEETLGDPRTRNRIGKAISRTMVKSY
jgi:hypothetical protein